MILGLIGCGNMGEAMLSGAISSGWVKANEVLVHTKTTSRMEELKGKYNIRIAESNAAVASEADLLILAVKPIVYEEAIMQIKSFLKDGAILLGIAPAYSISMLQKLIANEKVKIARSIPNTPALIGKGIAGVCFSSEMGADDKELVLGLFNSFGTGIEIREELMPAVGTLTGSGPAYVYMFIEAMAQAGIKLGIPAKDAYKLAAGTLEGSALMVDKTGKHPAKLRDEVCSPGGTTIEGVATLEKKGFGGIVMEAVEASTEKFLRMQREAEKTK
jgi:pyrroline-5-carboxylate reductase